MILAVLNIVGWTVLATALVGLSYLDLRDDHDRLQRLIDRGIDGGRRAILEMYVRTDTNVLGMALGFLLIGIMAGLSMLARLSVISDLFSIVFPVVLYGVLIWAIGAKLTNRRERRNLLRNPNIHGGPPDNHDLTQRVGDLESRLEGMARDHEDCERKNRALAEDQRLNAVELATLRSKIEQIEKEHPEIPKALGWGA